MAFKAELTKRLIARCGYRAFFIEANRYEFLAFDRAIKAGVADRAMLDAAVGGLWSRYAEFRPLGDFLLSRAQGGRLHLAGLDDQLGIAGATYTNSTMLDELTAPLPSPQAGDCRALLRTRLYWDNASPDMAQRERLRSCVATMRSLAVRSDLARMVAALDRMLVRDFILTVDQFAGREASMFAAFQETTASLPPATKVIVWGATYHLARDAKSWPSLAGRPNLGSLIHCRYGRAAFTLGFSALGGSWRLSPREPESPWPPAPVDALERRALPGNLPVAYVDRAAMRRWGNIPGRLWDDAFTMARWDHAIDGLVVFRTDRGPTLR